MNAWSGNRMAAFDVARITTRLFLTRSNQRRNLTNFRVLLVLAGVIASAGVIGEVPA